MDDLIALPLILFPAGLAVAIIIAVSVRANYKDLRCLREHLDELEKRIEDLQK